MSINTASGKRDIPPKPSRIISLVESATRMLYESGRNPSHGGEWKSPFVDITVTFRKPSRWCIKTAYQVHGPEIGLWRGYMNGAGHKNVGKPTLVYSPEQLAREIELGLMTAEQQQALIANALQVGLRSAENDR